jgi:hypothetical protein
MILVNQKIVSVSEKTTKNSTMKRKIFLLLILMMYLVFQSKAQGDLLITPKRVVFEGNKQKEELSLANMGKDTTTYSITFVQKKMQENGSFINIEKPDSGQMFADPFLRIFPRQVTLAPGEAQVIMLQCRRKPDMAAGEYRSHLFFRSEKDYKPLLMKSSSNDTGLLSVQLIPIYGMSIPIIIRSGEISINTTLSGLNLEYQKDTIARLNLTINRTGNISAYGDINVEFIPSQGKPCKIGIVTGVGVYTTISKRNISINLKIPHGMSLHHGMLKVRYTSPDEEKYIVYAEAEHVIN